MTTNKVKKLSGYFVYTAHNDSLSWKLQVDGAILADNQLSLDWVGDWGKGTLTVRTEDGTIFKGKWEEENYGAMERGQVEFMHASKDDFHVFSGSWKQDSSKGGSWILHLFEDEEE